MAFASTEKIYRQGVRTETLSLSVLTFKEGSEMERRD
jgi:hypothetical protein